MRQYLDLLRRILDDGVVSGDRTGTGTKSIFGHQMRFDLRQGFPIVTTKRIHLKSVIHELLWMVRGETNIRALKQAGVTIWDEWANENGDLGPVYGEQWRSWPVGEAIDYDAGGNKIAEKETIDQLADVITEIRSNPNSRRLIVTAWNPATVEQAALPPCHVLFQFYVRGGGLSCQLYQRSADAFLGVPFNIASYALLTMMVAQVTGLVAHEFVWTGGDCHLYLDHIEHAREQLTREPHPLPTMVLNPLRTDIDSFGYDDFVLDGYESHRAIAAKVSV